MGLLENWSAREANKVAAMTVLPEGFKMTIIPQPWIPVSERLPEDYELVMVGWAGRRDIGKGYVLSGKWHDPLVCKPDVNQPTHWMPLPPPPTCATDGR